MSDNEVNCWNQTRGERRHVPQASGGDAWMDKGDQPNHRSAHVLGNSDCGARKPGDNRGYMQYGDNSGLPGLREARNKTNCNKSVCGRTRESPQIEVGLDDQSISTDTRSVICEPRGDSSTRTQLYIQCGEAGKDAPPCHQRGNADRQAPSGGQRGDADRQAPPGGQWGDADRTLTSRRQQLDTRNRLTGQTLSFSDASKTR